MSNHIAVVSGDGAHPVWSHAGCIATAPSTLNLVLSPVVHRRVGTKHQFRERWSRYPQILEESQFVEPSTNNCALVIGIGQRSEMGADLPKRIGTVTLGEMSTQK